MDSTSWFIPVRVVTIFLVSFHLCNSADTISSTQFISDAKNESLLCSNGNFKLGFFTPRNSLNRYVGIWFHKVSEPTVVWVANRETPLNNGDGIFKITHDGNLAVFDKNSIIWSANVSLMQNSQTTNSTAKLLSSGNLVLTNGLTVVWQSFDYPTNTILPGMRFGLDRRTGLNRVLTSWKSESDPAHGEFYGLVDPRGSPQIFLYSRTLGGPYWRGGPYNGRTLSGSPIVTNQADIFEFSFVNNSDEVYLTFTAPNSSIFIKSALEPTGTFPAGVWRENNNVWTSFFNGPQNPCNTYMWCGPSSLCNSSSAVLCTCLTGFEPASNQDSKPNCLQKRRGLHSCGLGPGEGFLKMSGLKVPDARVARVFPNVSFEECEKECSKSCNCTGYASADINIGGRGCFAWYGELNDIRQYVDGQDFYLRVDAVELANMRKRSTGFRGTKEILVITAVFVSGVLMFFCCYYSWRKHAKKKGERAKQRYRDMILSDPTPTLSINNNSSIPKGRGESKNKELTFFDLDTVINATDNFSPAKKLGEGGFGPVYKGQLSDGQEIAVKRLSKNSGQGVIELRNEALLIANLQHKNLVKLLGCCIESEEKMLIYEYMPNKSLDYFIFDETRKSLLDWKKRFEIILGIARGILYLHQDSRLTIIHRDLKASNILLDEDFNPKISDFGTARIFGVNQSHENTSRVVGTFGYMSPEYVLGGFFSAKSDIFSFGVLLLEIICGKKSIGYFNDDAIANSNLIRYAWDLWSKDRALEMIDKSIMGESCTTHKVLRCIQVGLLCVQDSATERPTMLSVFFMLSNEATPLPSPKQPMFAVFKSHIHSDSTTRETNPFLNGVTVTMVD